MMTLRVGATLPRLSFRRLDGPGQVTWTQGPMATVVFVPHLDPCPECHDYLAELGASACGLQEWATRALVLTGPGWEQQAPAGVLLVDDTAGHGRAALGLSPAQAAVFQADRWGAIYQAEFIGAGQTHDSLPAASDLAGLAKYIDIQCPECGVPSKEWRGVSPFPLG